MTGTSGPADAAIVGCGIIGLAAAERLTADGLSVVLIDPAGPAGGATGASGGLVRAVDLAGAQGPRAARSLHRYLRRGWRGRWPAVREHGSLTLAAPGSRELAALSALSGGPEGRRVSVLSAREMSTRFPGLCVPGGFAGVYEPRAGWLPARPVAEAMLRDARETGGLRLLRVRAAGVLTDGSRVTGVRTEAGVVAARTVLLAAGVGTQPLARTAGITLPLRTRSVSYCLFRPAASAVPAGLPVVVDTSTGAWLRRWDSAGTVLAGVASARTGVPPTVIGSVPDAEQRRVREVIRHRWPEAAGARAVGGVTAYDAMTDDGSGAVTAWPSPQGLITAAGWNGGGFKLAPEIGCEIAGLVRKVLTE